MSTPEKFAEMTEAVGERLADQFNVLREKAEHFIAEEIESMKDRGDAIELTTDELAMIKAYRAFLDRSPVGSVFSWRQSFIDRPGIVVPQEPSLIIDPREVSRASLGD